MKVPQRGQDLAGGEGAWLVYGGLYWEGDSTLEIPKPSHKIMQVGMVRQKTSLQFFVFQPEIHLIRRQSKTSLEINGQVWYAVS